MPYYNEYQPSWIADSPSAPWTVWGIWALGWLFCLIGGVTYNTCDYSCGGYIGLASIGGILWWTGLIMIIVRFVKRRVVRPSNILPDAHPNPYKQVHDPMQPPQSWQGGAPNMGDYNRQYNQSRDVAEFNRPLDPYSNQYELRQSPPRPLPNMPPQQRVPVPDAAFPRPSTAEERRYSYQSNTTPAPATNPFEGNSEEAIRRQHIEALLASKDIQDQINKSVAMSMESRRAGV